MSEGVRERPLAQKTLYTGKILNLRVDDVELPDGRKAIREVVEHEPAVGILAVGEDGKALLVRQYRYAVGENMLEIPAGIVEKDEPFDETARRELQEEIGFYPGRLRSICSFYNSPGFCTELMELFYATDLRPSKLEEDYDEFISVVPVDKKDIPSLISEGKIRDAKTLAALSWWTAFGDDE
ncbi:MAG: NUDIX hydrolase [Synergistaceae bacterium]|nr:NUDIX hydrolase [Synergistota bacterium]NLM71089.1 NUDIX hydrolase [Synergistaceae bacterium]